MRFVTVLVYVVLGATLAWFAAINWLPITLRLWGDYELAIRLPALLLLTFLLGALPLAVFHSLSRWRWKRRVMRLEQALGAQTAPASAPVPADVPPSETVAPGP